MGLEIDKHFELTTAATPDDAAFREREARDAAAYVTRHARDDGDRGLLLAALGLATPAGAAVLAVGSLALLRWAHTMWRKP